MGGKSSASQKGGRDKDPKGRNDHKQHEKDAEVYKGLCMNCANRFDCLLPKCEGGVWHCEEYIEES
jgi:hypothetical protein